MEKGAAGYSLLRAHELRHKPHLASRLPHTVYSRLPVHSTELGEARGRMKATVVSVEPLRSKVSDLHLITLDIPNIRAQRVAGPSRGAKVRLIGEGGQCVIGSLAIRGPDDAAWVLILGAAVEKV